MDNSTRITPDLIWRMLDESAVIVSPQEGQVRVLNEVGTVIWQMLANGRSRSEISNALVERYSVSPTQAEEDMKQFLLELHERGLLSLA